jgi:ubiquinone/menaquinone biosynthesis C-methylase UbiE
MAMMEDYTQRFTGRAEIYSKYRPTYPKGVVDILRKEANFDSAKIVADIGSGTGILTRLLLENGNEVFAVEPNDEMRSFAESSLSGYRNFRSLRGTAEETTLADQSVDLVAVGQALHWFDHKKSRTEFLRISRRGGFLCVLYNDREKNGHLGIMEDYEQLVIKYARNKAPVERLEGEELLSKIFPEWAFRKFTLPNYQHLDFEGLAGRICSASYIPQPSEQAYPNMESDLETMFEKYQIDDRVTLIYKTSMFLGSLSTLHTKRLNQ